MWELIVQMKGDQPDEATVDRLEDELCDALDAADFDYADVKAR